jgi:hypothetical protein
MIAGATIFQLAADHESSESVPIQPVRLAANGMPPDAGGSSTIADAKHLRTNHRHRLNKAQRANMNRLEATRRRKLRFVTEKPTTVTYPTTKNPPVLTTCVVTVRNVSIACL